MQESVWTRPVQCVFSAEIVKVPLFAATMRTSTIPFLIKGALLTSAAGAMLSLPVSAQQSVQDYQLPDPNATPTPAPRAQGPVDESGIVPVAPRVLPTERQAPVPVATPTPLPVPTVTPPATAEQSSPTPQPTFRSGPVPAEPAPSRQIASDVGPATQNIGDEGEAVAEGSTGNAPLIPTVPDQPETAAGTPATAPSSDYWPWIAGGLLALLVLAGAAYLAFGRRRTAAPLIEAPVVAGPGAAAGMALLAEEKPRFAVSVQIESAMRSMMMLTVKYHLSIANRSDRALRDVTISGDLISARRTAGMGEQLANAATQLPETATVERIGPHQTRSVTGTLQLAIQQIEVLRQGSTPMFVPLLRIKVEGDGIDPFVETYAVGVGNATAGARLHPLPLNGPPGSYQGVRAKPIAAKAA